jgi:hypothetical protein
VIDGVRDPGYTQYRSGVEYTSYPGFDATTWLSWDAGMLFVYVEMNTPAALRLYVDGSAANGFWHGNDTYVIALVPNQTAPLLVLDGAGAREPGDPIAGGSLVTSVSGGTTILEASIPAALGQGFGLTGETTTGFPTGDGVLLGFNLVFAQFNGAGSVWGVPAAHVNELYRFDDLTLTN